MLILTPFEVVPDHGVDGPVQLDARRLGAADRHVYQQRTKSFPIQNDDHFCVACRYVKRNALRAGVVERAEDYRWGSKHAAWARADCESRLDAL